MFLEVDQPKKLSVILPTVETKKLNWKDKLKRDLYKENLKYFVEEKAKKKTDIKWEEEKRVAAKSLSRLFDKKNPIFLEDDQQEYPHHGNYSSYIPLKKNQQTLKHQLQNTFPYLEYLLQKSHQETSVNVLNEVSNHLRAASDNNSVDIAWRSCLRKYLCEIDVIRAIDVYVQFLKKGTGVLSQYHLLYGNGCSKEVFFHRICQAAKFFKPIIKINKNVRSTIQVNQQISEVTLPKTLKYMFCSLCLRYDCSQHNMDETAYQLNCQYVSKNNMINKRFHLNSILKLLKFQMKMEGQALINMQVQEGEMQDEIQQNHFCVSKCYKRLLHQKQEYLKIKNNRKPIMSPLHRSLIKMGVELFSYDPCFIWKLLTQDIKTPLNQNIATCQSVYFYFTQEYNLIKKLQNKLYNSEQEMLANQTSRIGEESHPIKLPVQNKKGRRERVKLEKDLENYKIGVCYHYFIGHEVFDHNCEKCCCKARGFCLPECQCHQDCKIKKKGCACKAGDCRTKKCPCFVAADECNPFLCKGCFDTKGINNKKNNCKNSKILKEQTKHIKIGQSNIMGLGAFAGEDIEKDQLVIIYTGEVIQHQLDYLREGLRFDDTFYNFNLPNNDGAIDARFMGNKSRFINHQKGGEQNLYSQNVFSEGRHQTVMYAKKNIKKNEQLFFDYDIDGTLVKNFPGKYDYIKKKKY